MPIVAPIFKPNDREMIKYSPPPSTRLLVAISDIANAVGMVTKWPKSTIKITPQKPKVPTAKPKRKNNMAPRIVDIAVKKTGAVPNFLFLIILIKLETLFICVSKLTILPANKKLVLKKLCLTIFVKKMLIYTFDTYKSKLFIELFA